MISGQIQKNPYFVIKCEHDKMNVKCENEYEMNMEMTLSITNKLVGNMFHENKCFFYMSGCAQLRLKCEKFQLLIGWANVLRASRGIIEAATKCVLLKKVFLDISQISQKNT